MRAKRWLLLVFLLVLLAAALPAKAEEDLAGKLASYGLTTPEIEAFSAMVAGAGQALTQEELLAMLEEFMAEGAGELAGQEKDGVYTDPNGYSFKVPEGWTLQPNQIGPTVMLTGPADDKGLMPTITVLATSQAEDDIMAQTQQQIDDGLKGVLPNYQFIALDEFDYKNLKAHELVIMYGTAEDTMLMQYQTYFQSKDRVYIITMTTRAEEAVHDRTLDTYDSFLTDFQIVESRGNG